ncbi:MULTISPECIES: succinate dehydrogenase cytochrome b558 subunit [Paenibacillus]|uniref:succinate dehydrogenase cytochrome b558 subunit n=1 Tax=Paenibacillus TaxID=44249 RepID=UPI00020D6A88|nr:MULTISPECIES: succinate dehydrogenase cytochrome b558 subunit [Paenibacillus]EGL15333.1 succinate dehydrogenase cytochrome B subunit, b558 family [Paenibacillus sp. HGF7]EPD89643.1 b558 family succinate dehydrogenase (or fumarate reductase) cytochrome B subunit [Paenibacillus sp. HGH0039]MBV6712180.1 succinate dehydrogenase cytochrome b558 subunit [Paenibacillus chitinolyticus]
MGKNSYFNRKLHSLLGVIPVGFFLIEHLLTNFEATKGPEAFVDQINWLNSLPLVLVLEIVGIWIPLLYHAVYGLYVAFTARNNVSRYGYFRNQMFLWQRITGVLTFLFVAWHFFETRFQVALGNVEHERLGQTMHDIVSQPLLLTIYVIGVIAASFHFTNGMWSFLVSWGITVGPRAQRVSSYIWIGLFLVMSVMFIASLVAFKDPQFQELPVVSGMIGGVTSNG